MCHGTLEQAEREQVGTQADVVGIDSLNWGHVQSDFGKKCTAMGVTASQEWMVWKNIDQKFKLLEIMRKEKNGVETHRFTCLKGGTHSHIATTSQEIVI